MHTCTLSESTTGVHFHFWLFVGLRLYFPVNNFSAMSAKWRLTVHPILVYQGEKGGRQMSSYCFLEGANIHYYAFVEGAIILPCQLLGGQMSTHLLRGKLSSPVNCLGADVHTCHFS